MREWGKTMGCEGANIKMISDGNTELSKVNFLLPSSCLPSGAAGLLSLSGICLRSVAVSPVSQVAEKAAAQEVLHCIQRPSAS